MDRTLVDKAGLRRKMQTLLCKKPKHWNDIDLQEIGDLILGVHREDIKEESQSTQPTPVASETLMPTASASTPPAGMPQRSRQDTGVFLTIVFGLFSLVAFLLGANGVITMPWNLSLIFYVVVLTVFCWAFLKWNVPDNWSPVWRSIALCVGALIVAWLGYLGVTTAYRTDQATPRFGHEIHFSQVYPYADGSVVNRVVWSADMREYIFSITNETDIAIVNFRERLLLPVQILSATPSDSSDAERIRVDRNDEHGRDRGIVLHNNKIIETIDNEGNWALVRATKMPPHGKIVLKIIGRLPIGGISQDAHHFWVLYGCDFSRRDKVTPYGRMVRNIVADKNGMMSFREEFHKLGHVLKADLIGGQLISTDITQTPMFNPAEEVSDKPDDR